MTPEEISKIIRAELDQEKDFFNPHSVDLDTTLIRPIQQIYCDPLDKTKTQILWTVLEESRDESGYKIFYDESVNAFGLGIKSQNDELIALGIYGSFINTLSCM